MYTLKPISALQFVHIVMVVSLNEPIHSHFKAYYAVDMVSANFNEDIIVNRYNNRIEKKKKYKAKCTKEVYDKKKKSIIWYTRLFNENLTVIKWKVRAKVLKIIRVLLKAYINIREYNLCVCQVEREQVLQVKHVRYCLLRIPSGIQSGPSAVMNCTVYSKTDKIIMGRINSEY